MPTVNATGVVCRAPWGGVLFLKRAEGFFTGHWCLPGGGIDDGETPERAAHRELLEETGHYLTGDISLLHTADNGFVTHLAHVSDTFTPALNHEHSEYVWAFPDNPPAPLHPGVKSMISAIDAGQVNSDINPWEPVAGPEPEVLPGMDGKATLAMDRATVRRIDDSGYLHIEVSNISKANICPYRGNEIPGWQQLGLDPDAIYQLYRDPEELAKGAPTFNNMPILSQHMPVNPDDWDTEIPSEIKIGSTGTDADFAEPYLQNSLVVWSGSAIKNIDSDVQKDISCGYFYIPDMTPGDVDGVPFHGVMREIRGNHVAIVPEGRAGPDVVVGDSKHKEIETMPTPAKLSRKAVAARGAIVAYLAPKLAADAKINLRPALVSVTRKNFIAQKPTIMAGVKAATKGKLAQDADIEDLVELLDTLGVEDADTALDEDDDMQPDMGADIDVAGAAKAFLKGKLSPEDYAEFEGMMTDKPADPPAAADEGDDDGKPKPIDQAAMDSAIKAAVAASDRRHADIRDALTEVKPFVGELAMSFDSGAAVRRHALKMLGVADHANIHESALSSVLKVQAKPGRITPTIAQDAAGSASFATAFPGAARIAR